MRTRSAFRSTKPRRMADLARAARRSSARASETRELERAHGRRRTPRWPEHFRRTSAYLTHPVFNTHRTETEMLRYIRKLESRDLSLCTSMIPLGSCTMKLNATAEMFPVSWPTVGAAPSLRADRPDARLPDAVPAARGMAGRNHRHGRRLAAAQRRLAGRIRRAARHSRLSSGARRGGTAAFASFPFPRTAPIPPARSWPA